MVFTFAVYDDDPIFEALVVSHRPAGTRVVSINPGETGPWGHNALVCDWIMPSDWIRTKNLLLNDAENRGIPGAVFTSDGIDRSTLSAVWPNLVLMQKSGLLQDLKKWMGKCSSKS